MFITLFVGIGIVNILLIKEPLSTGAFAFITLAVSLIITLSIAAMIHFYQGKLYVDGEGLHTKDRIIRFSEVRQLKVGAAGITVVGRGSEISLTNLYANYLEAIEAVNRHISVAPEVQIIGDPRYVQKYFNISGGWRPESISPVVFRIKLAGRDFRFTVYRLLGIAMIILGLVGLVVYKDVLMGSESMLNDIAITAAGLFLLASETSLGGFRKVRVEWLTFGMLGGIILQSFVFEHSSLGLGIGMVSGIILSMLAGPREVEVRL